MSARRARAHAVDSVRVDVFGVLGTARISYPVTASREDVLDAIDSLSVALLNLRDAVEADAAPASGDDLEDTPYLTTDLPAYCPEEEWSPCLAPVESL